MMAAAGCASDHWGLAAQKVWLFLDYDGTLAEFSPTPETVTPDPAVIALIRRLADHPLRRVAVVSGRRLGDLQKLLPVASIYLAGVYGIELLTPSGEMIQRADLHEIRPFLARIKPRWQALIEGQEGFYLEDKGWALALHARFAEEDAAARVLSAARDLPDNAPLPDRVRFLEGRKFLEVAPSLADKGEAVAHLLKTYRWRGAKPIYIGDDDKDAPAFGVVRSKGGRAVQVSNPARQVTVEVDCVLESPAAAREWLDGLA